jgi:hypothetical protein
MDYKTKSIYFVKVDRGIALRGRMAVATWGAGARVPATNVDAGARGWTRGVRRDADTGSDAGVGAASGGNVPSGRPALGVPYFLRPCSSGL